MKVLSLFLKMIPSKLSHHKQWLREIGSKLSDRPSNLPQAGVHTSPDIQDFEKAWGQQDDGLSYRQTVDRDWPHKRPKEIWKTSNRSHPSHDQASSGKSGQKPMSFSKKAGKGPEVLKDIHPNHSRQ